MKFSIFTPVHNCSRLRPALESLLEQTYKDFEWVILLNQKASFNDELIKEICYKLKDKVTIAHISDIENAKDNGYIGNYKKLCCSLASGDVLVELDYDDALEPCCLEVLKEHFDDDSVDFVYSSCFEYKDGKTVAPFNTKFGWQYNKCQDTDRFITLAFEPTPINFSYIWYAPNHVRSWRRKFYNEIGGHNPELDVCDDHDLCCRTYIHGNVVMEPRPLYRYYTGEGLNTCYGEKNKKIQQITRTLHDRYIEDLACKWCDDNGLKRYDLCCHTNKRDGYIGVDSNNHPDVDVGWDLNDTPWPFEDNSVGVFRMQDALEHIKDPIKTMKELHRCLAPLGWALIEVPSTDGRGAYQDPTHVSFWNSNSFWYYTKQAQSQYIGTPVKFQLNRILNYFPSQYHQTHNILYTKAHLVKLHNDIYVPPGGREI